jgi:hypothetical protein
MEFPSAKLLVELYLERVTLQDPRGIIHACLNIMKGKKIGNTPGSGNLMIGEDLMNAVIDVQKILSDFKGWERKVIISYAESGVMTAAQALRHHPYYYHKGGIARYNIARKVWFKFVGVLRQEGYLEQPPEEVVSLAA